MQNRRKPFIYLPGLLSLVLLPMLCVWALEKHHSFETKYRLELYSWEPGLYERTGGQLGIKEPYEPRKYLDFTLDNKDQDNHKKLELFTKASKDLVASKDTIRGVHLHFGKDAPYWTLVDAMDLLDQEGVYVRSFYKSDIWVWNPVYHKFVDFEEPFICGGVDFRFDPEFEKAQKEADRKAMNEFINESISTYYPSGLMYLVLCVLAFRKLRTKQEIT